MTRFIRPIVKKVGNKNSFFNKLKDWNNNFFIALLTFVFFITAFIFSTPSQADLLQKTKGVLEGRMYPYDGKQKYIKLGRPFKATIEIWPWKESKLLKYQKILGKVILNYFFVSKVESIKRSGNNFDVLEVVVDLVLVKEFSDYSLQYLKLNGKKLSLYLEKIQVVKDPKVGKLVVSGIPSHPLLTPLRLTSFIEDAKKVPTSLLLGFSKNQVIVLTALLAVLLILLAIKVKRNSSQLYKVGHQGQQKGFKGHEGQRESRLMSFNNFFKKAFGFVFYRKGSDPESNQIEGEQNQMTDLGTKAAPSGQTDESDNEEGHHEEETHEEDHHEDDSKKLKLIEGEEGTLEYWEEVFEIAQGREELELIYERKNQWLDYMGGMNPAAHNFLNTVEKYRYKPDWDEDELDECLAYFDELRPLLKGDGK